MSDEEEIDDELDEDLADGDVDGADFVDGEDDSFEGDDEFADEDEDDDDDTESSGPSKKSDDDDDDDEEPDPDDVEEDLDTILQDRLASGEDLEDDDDEDEVVAPPIEATEGDKVAPKRDNEWTCTGCFLIVSSRQFGKRESATCPSGESDCPSLEKL